MRVPDILIGTGLRASNYLDDDQPRFKHRKRNRPIRHLVLHETCGNTADGCINTLLKKGYGVQLVVAPNGHMSCHGDLLKDRMVHANQLNNTSVGIELVNPYNNIYIIDPNIWAKTIPAKWWTWVPSLKTKSGINKSVERLLKRRGLRSVPKRYVVPTESQILAMRLFVPWLCEIIGVPYEFPTAWLNKKQRKLPGMKRRPKPVPPPGVIAHRDFSKHADGRYLLEDLIKNQKIKR